MLAVDLGGTRLKAAPVDPVTGAVVGDVLVAEHAGSLEAARAVLRPHLDGGPVALCVPGLVDDGRVSALPGKLDGIVGRDLAEWLGAERAVVANDAVAYAVGEAVHGAGAGARRVVVVTIGTGVGTAVVEDGRPLGEGPLGGGLLGGQVPLGEPGTGPYDTSGRQGTFEAWCRADRIAECVREAGVPVADAAEAFARRSEPAVARALTTYRSWLVRGLSLLALAHAPDVVVVGGGPLVEGSPVLDGVEPAVQGRLWEGQHAEVRRAALGDTAALVGLAVLARGSA